MPSELNGSRPGVFEDWRGFRQDVAVGLMSKYLQRRHDFEVRLNHMPEHGPLLALTTHFSILDVVALMTGDPYYPRATFAVKRSMTKTPVIKSMLKLWQTPVVDRDGSDIEAAKQIFQLLGDGRVVCIAAQGTRSTNGHLGPMDASLVNLSLRTAAKKIPVVPLAEIGTFEALPKGSIIPRKEKITLVDGEPIDLSEWVRLKRVDREAAIQEAAIAIQKSLSDLLPDQNKPLPGTKAVWRSSEYVD